MVPIPHRRHVAQLLTAALLLTSSTHAQTETTAAEELRAAVGNYLAGYASNTTDGYFQHYAEDVIFWWPNGLRQTREAYYRSWEEGLNRSDNNVKSAVADDLRIHVSPSGEAGVASFIWRIERAASEPYALHTSTTFFKRHDTWQVVHMHFNRPPSPTARHDEGRQSGGQSTRSPSPPAPCASGPPEVVAEVQDVIAKLTQAYAANDLSTYFAVYSPDLTWWGPVGRNTKDAYEQSWTEDVRTTDGLAGADVSDLRIQAAPNGDLAVASYLLTASRKNADTDRSRNVTYQVSTTMLKENGTWQIVHLHRQILPGR